MEAKEIFRPTSIPRRGMSVVIRPSEAEEALARSERRLSQALDMALVCIITFDEKQRIVSFCRRAEKIFGYTAQEILGQPLSLLVPSRFEESHDAHFREFAAGAETVRRMNERSNVRGRRRDGTEFPAEVSISKSIEDGKATFTAVIRDITERDRAEIAFKDHARQLEGLNKELAESERKFRALFEASADAIVLVDRNGKIVDVNPAGQILAGRERAELLSMDMTNFLRPEDLPQVWGYLKDLLEGRLTPEMLDIDVRPADGRLRSVQIRSRVVYEVGLEPLIEVIARDVTEQKEMHRRLLETERFAAVGEMAAFVAHEINTPLANIALLVSSALRLEKDSVVREKIEKIDVQRHRAANIITQILSFSRRPEIRPMDTDLREVLKAAAEQAEAFRKPEVSFVRDLGDRLVMAHVDSLQMQEVFVNLIKNAFEATDSGVVEVRIREEPKAFAVSVRDTGSGIPPEAVRRLFT
ncbi:MAG: PAS domain S-box protein, partial [Thermoplasmata archaeon]